MAISGTKGQGWRAITTQYRKARDILTSTLVAFLVKFRNTGYYNPGWLCHAGSQDAILSCLVLISTFCCTAWSNPSTLQTDTQTARSDVVLKTKLCNLCNKQTIKKKKQKREIQLQR